ncbi:hypothetical protein EDC04DRAFT_432959 [Pisolithus marmoratus]|nr:hypothetical protein EDC04DRAFT_432959 [Pisolithus marmoratus]
MSRVCAVGLFGLTDAPPVGSGTWLALCSLVWSFPLTELRILADTARIVCATFCRLESMRGFQPNTIRTTALDVTKDEDDNAAVQNILEERM